MDNINTLNYNHKLSGISFNYPEGWIVEELEDSTILVICEEIEDNWQANVHIDFEKLVPNLSLSGFIQRVQDNYKLSKDGYMLEGVNVYAEAEVPHGRLVYQHSTRGLRLHTNEFYVEVVPSLLVIASASTTLTLKNKYSPYFNVILQSIKFSE